MLHWTYPAIYRSMLIVPLATSFRRLWQLCQLIEKQWRFLLQYDEFHPSVRPFQQVLVARKPPVMTWDPAWTGVNVTSPLISSLNFTYCITSKLRKNKLFDAFVCRICKKFKSTSQRVVSLSRLNNKTRRSKRSRKDLIEDQIVCP